MLANPRATGTTTVVFNPETVKDSETRVKLDLMDRKVRLESPSPGRTSRARSATARAGDREQSGRHFLPAG
ncbi:hypothetical protein [Novosphingobium sp.]|uniref:hypothetical protein n=1 Tax=Novosphingobium sp. TaxID=1874826 RepID=UPI001ED0784C|nr:hypothetical protein [Novosphingobium sp.]MBK9009379.1 hypothetical protein [Novosphingobium sp.]